MADPDFEIVVPDGDEDTPQAEITIDDAHLADLLEAGAE